MVLQGPQDCFQSYKLRMQQGSMHRHRLLVAARRQQLPVFTNPTHPHLLASWAARQAPQQHGCQPDAPGVRVNGALTALPMTDVAKKLKTKQSRSTPV
jgi:hypothetical protein